MTWVILLLALLALCVGRRSKRHASLVSSALDGIADAHALDIQGERHATDDGLSSQPLLSRPGAQTGKARPALTRLTRIQRSPWQGDAPVALNLSKPKGLLAIDARIPSGVSTARAQTRAP